MMMNLESTLSIYGGGPGSGRHKYAVGDRVMRNPNVAKQWAENKPHNRGKILSQEVGKDNNGRTTLAYKVWSDQDELDSKNSNLDKWERPNPKGTFFTEKELVPEK